MDGWHAMNQVLETPFSAACRLPWEKKAEHPLPAMSQPTQSRTVLRRPAAPAEGLAQPQFIPQRQRATQNSECCATDRQDAPVLSPPGSPTPDSKRLRGFHAAEMPAVVATAGRHSGRSQGSATLRSLTENGASQIYVSLCPISPVIFRAFSTKL